MHRPLCDGYHNAAPRGFFVNHAQANFKAFQMGFISPPRRAFPDDCDDLFEDFEH
jgi:hypothetical protein